MKCLHGPPRGGIDRQQQLTHGVNPINEEEVKVEFAFNNGKADFDVCWPSRNDPCTSLTCQVSYLDKDANEKAFYPVLSEAGDILWYLYALSLSLPGGKFHAEKSLNNSEHTSPILISCDLECRDQSSSSLGIAYESYNNHQMLDLKDRLISAMGKLCGSVKKFSRGDQSWEDIFQKRIQRDFDALLITLKQILHFLQVIFRPNISLSLEDAMKCNINKISHRKLKGTIKGDGENR